MSAAEGSVIDAKGELRTPARVTCSNCRFVWIGFYLPMDMSACGKLMSRLTCPMCASTKILIIEGGSRT